MPPLPESPPGASPERFSLTFFVFTVLGTLAALLVMLRFLAPGVWTEQFLPSAWAWVAAFLALSLVNCFVEFFFHRYALHTPVISVLRRFYRQHTLHHALTRVVRRHSRDGRDILFIENRFPIVEPEQGEASFFPWYALAAFAGVSWPLFTVLQWLLPAFPWFIAGFGALAVSLALYEILHAIDHWPLETWAPLITHPFWGRFWQPVYGFHLRHHAVTDCNESISGFFGLPLADWVFGTCMIPQTVYADGEAWSPEKFRRPRPRGIIRRLDAWSRIVVQRQRARALAPQAAATDPAGPVRPPSVLDRAQTRGEEIANWVTHGLGLVLSVAAFTLLIVFASRRGDAWHVVSFTVFGLTLLMLHAISTLRQARRSGGSRALFQKLNHAAVLLLIAGTYTPFLMTNLRGPRGWTLFGVIWGVCGAGAMFKFLFGGRYAPASTVAYLFVGWLVVVALKPLAAQVPVGGLWLLFAGGLCYTSGVIFHRWRRLRFHHAVRHAFVLGGSVCHILAVLLFLLPGAR